VRTQIVGMDDNQEPNQEPKEEEPRETDSSHSYQRLPWAPLRAAWHYFASMQVPRKMRVIADTFHIPIHSIGCVLLAQALPFSLCAKATQMDPSHHLKSKGISKNAIRQHHKLVDVHRAGCTSSDSRPYTCHILLFSHRRKMSMSMLSSSSSCE
jgi:hypothetical protein